MLIGRYRQGGDKAVLNSNPSPIFQKKINRFNLYFSENSIQSYRIEQINCQLNDHAFWQFTRLVCLNKASPTTVPEDNRPAGWVGFDVK